MTIRVSTRDMAALRLMLRDIKDGATKATSRAINKTLPGVRTDAVAEIADNLNITKTRIKKDCKINKAYYRNPRGVFSAKGKPVNLGEFANTRATKRGVSVKVKKAGKRTVLKHAFFRMLGAENDQRRVFSRMYTGPRTKVNPNVRYAKIPKRYRLPIEKLDGPRIEDILAAKEVMDVVMAKASARYAQNMAHEAEYLLSKHR